MKHYNGQGVLKMLHIKEIRKRSGKSQQEVADFLKKTRPSYTNIENNKRDPDTQTIIALSEFFNCSIDEIFGKKPRQPVKLSEKQHTVLQLFNQLNEEGRNEAINYLEYLISKGYIKSNKAGILSSKASVK